MQVTIKTLSNEQFQLDVTPESTVLDIKAQIFALKGHEVTWQKLIYAGKVLDDADSVSSAGIQPNTFMVLMVRAPKDAKPKAQPAPVPAPAPVQTTPAPSTPTPAPISTPAPTTPVQTPAPATSAPQTPTAGSFVSGSELEGTISQLMEMGFPRDQVIVALRAAFNNPDRAVEYLFNPESMPKMDAPQPVQPTPVQQPPAVSGTPAQPTTQAQPQGPVTSAPPLFQNPSAQQSPAQGQPGAGGSSPFDFLRNHPQFTMLRLMVQQNPSLLQPVLQQVGAQNPELMQLINSNNQAFVQLLQEPVSQEEVSSIQNMPGMAALGGMGGEGGAGGSPGGVPPGASVVQITPEEKEAIDRLEALGFPRQQAIEAYLACDKNENLAANFLLNGGGLE